jgi:hypothetical protein
MSTESLSSCIKATSPPTPAPLVALVLTTSSMVMSPTHLPRSPSRTGSERTPNCRMMSSACSVCCERNMHPLGQPSTGTSWLVRGQRRTHGHISSPRTTPQCVLRPRRAATCRARGGIRPSCGELPSASQEPVGSSGASVALMGTSGPPTPHHSARCARGEHRPAEPGRAWPRAEEKKETALQHAVGIRTGIRARACASDTPSNRKNAIPYRYELLNIRPPKFPCAGPSRACGTAPASQGSIPPESYFALV